jgi:hypothetical protein
MVPLFVTDSFSIINFGWSPLSRLDPLPLPTLRCTLGSLGTGNLGKGKNLLARGESSLSLGHLQNTIGLLYVKLKGTLA